VVKSVRVVNRVLVKAFFNTMDWWGISPLGPFLCTPVKKKMAYFPKAKALGPVLSK
jgi:hypothetical protein